MTDRVLLLTDSPHSPLAADLEILYPGRLDRRNFLTEGHDAASLQGHRAVVTACHLGINVGKLNYAAVTEHARRGGLVISTLFEYARNRGLTFAKTHVGDRLFPALRVEVECDVTRGYARGDELWWYGTSSSAPDMLYSNQMLQRQVFGVQEADGISVLATSTVNGGAMIVEERIGAGRIVAMDLLSPIRPFYNSYGSTNKYVFLGNLIGGTVRYGKHFPRKLPYDEFVGAMRELAARHRGLRVEDEGLTSDGRRLWTFGIGAPACPTMYFGGALHGWEWENCYGLMRLAELICEQPVIEGLDTRRFHIKIAPIQNPYGYDRFVRHNARGVDLNRNFDSAWEQCLVEQDVAMPWDFDYKGTRPASEPETQAIQGMIDRYRPRVVIDFHTADYAMMPAGGDEATHRAIQEDIKARLKDRYIHQQPYGGAYKQANMDSLAPIAQRCPYMVSYAADRGVPVAFLLEMSGNRDGAHGLVMTSDIVVEICLAAMKVGGRAARPPAAPLNGEGERQATTDERSPSGPDQRVLA